MIAVLHFVGIPSPSQQRLYKCSSSSFALGPRFLISLYGMSSSQAALLFFCLVDSSFQLCPC